MGLAREVAVENYGHGVFVRGLVEVSNRCAGGCYYCGLRAENRNVNRYSLSEEEIVGACRDGYELGLRSVVLQGGEVYDKAEMVASVVRKVKANMPDVAVTLSLGEQTSEVYDLWRKAGADRYLLRHETATKEHYARLHPERMSYDNRQRCLADLKSMGYQVGAGFMVGSPFQSEDELAREIEYLVGLQPQMVGIGPYIPQCDTPFADQKRGGVEQTLLMVALTRLALPKALIPSTTALASSDQQGMTRGILAGANVVMPNITPPQYRADYAIYDGKKSSGTEAGEGLLQLADELQAIGYEAVLSRGDHLDFMKR
jgi:biotin synthase